MRQHLVFYGWIAAIVALAYFGGTRPTTLEPEREVAATRNFSCSAIATAFPDILTDPTQLPESIADWGNRLRDFGDVNGILVPFSRAPGATSLRRPRVLLTLASPFLNNHPRDPFPSKRDLSKRLFIGITTAPNQTQTLEFISWNTHDRRFDFGVIENFDQPDKRKLVNTDAKRAECLACHRTSGPIFPVNPWTGTGVDPLLGVAMMEEAIEVDAKPYKGLKKALEFWKDRAKGQIGSLRLGLTDPKNQNQAEAKLLRNSTLHLNGRDTGVRFIELSDVERSAAFDGAVRDANRFVHLPNEVLAGLPKELRPLALRVIVARSLQDTYGEFGPEILEDFPRYLSGLQDELKKKVKTLRFVDSEILSSRPSEIRDFDPVSGIPRHHPVATSDDSISYIDTIRAYDKQRQTGDTGVPEKFTPSNVPAFATDGVPPMYTISTAIADGLPGRVELYRKDLDALLKFLQTPTGDRGAALLHAVLESPEMAEDMQPGVPNREALVHALYRAARAEARRQKHTGIFPNVSLRVADLTPCDSAQASGNTEIPIASPEQAPLCARCHLGADKTPRMRFDFDPEDRAAWQAALDDSKREERTRTFLGKVLRRLDRESMPPDDSPEHKLLEKSKRRARDLQDLREYLHTLAE